MDHPAPSPFGFELDLPRLNSGFPANEGWCFTSPAPGAPTANIFLCQRFGPTPLGAAIEWSSSGPCLKMDGPQMALFAASPEIFDALRELADASARFGPAELSYALESSGLYRLANPDEAPGPLPFHQRFDAARARSMTLFADLEAWSLEQATDSPERGPKPRSTL